jgi:hypothetical protein
MPSTINVRDFKISHPQMTPLGLVTNDTPHARTTPSHALRVHQFCKALAPYTVESCRDLLRWFTSDDIVNNIYENAAADCSLYTAANMSKANFTNHMHANFDILLREMLIAEHGEEDLYASWKGDFFNKLPESLTNREVFRHYHHLKAEAALNFHLVKHLVQETSRVNVFPYATYQEWINTKEENNTALANERRSFERTAFLSSFDTLTRTRLTRQDKSLEQVYADYKPLLNANAGRNAPNDVASLQPLLSHPTTTTPSNAIQAAQNSQIQENIQNLTATVNSLQQTVTTAFQRPAMTANVNNLQHPVNAMQRSNITCYNCHQQGHHQRDCPRHSTPHTTAWSNNNHNYNNNNNRTRPNVTCHNCRQQGHFQRDCPQRSPTSPPIGNSNNYNNHSPRRPAHQSQGYNQHSDFLDAQQQQFNNNSNPFPQHQNQSPRKRQRQRTESVQFEAGIHPPVRVSSENVGYDTSLYAYFFRNTLVQPPGFQVQQQNAYCNACNRSHNLPCTKPPGGFKGFQE